MTPVGYHSAAVESLLADPSQVGIDGVKVFMADMHSLVCAAVESPCGMYRNAAIVDVKEVESAEQLAGFFREFLGGWLESLNKQGSK